MTSTPDPRDQTTSARLDPIGEASEADVAEQQQTIDGGGTVSDPSVTSSEATEADALEQGATVTDDGAAEEEAWPRADEGGDDRD